MADGTDRAALTLRNGRLVAVRRWARGHFARCSVVFRVGKERISETSARETRLVRRLESVADIVPTTFDRLRRCITATNRYFFIILIIFPHYLD